MCARIFGSLAMVLPRVSMMQIGRSEESSLIDCAEILKQRKLRRRSVLVIMVKLKSI